MIPPLFENQEVDEQKNITKGDLVKAFSIAIIGFACPLVFLFDDVRKAFQ